MYEQHLASLTKDEKKCFGNFNYQLLSYLKILFKNTLFYSYTPDSL